MISQPFVLRVLASNTNLSDNDVDAIGERTAVIRVYGTVDEDAIVYAAARTSGPYSDTDHDDIRDGVGSTWNNSAVNGNLVSLMVSDLEPDTIYYYGAFIDYIDADDSDIVHGSFQTAAEVQRTADSGQPLPWRLV